MIHKSIIATLAAPSGRGGDFAIDFQLLSWSIKESLRDREAYHWSIAAKKQMGDNKQGITGKCVFTAILDFGHAGKSIRSNCSDCNATQFYEPGL